MFKILAFALVGLVLPPLLYVAGLFFGAVAEPNPLDTATSLVVGLLVLWTIALLLVALTALVARRVRMGRLASTSSVAASLLAVEAVVLGAGLSVLIIVLPLFVPASEPDVDGLRFALARLAVMPVLGATILISIVAVRDASAAALVVDRAEEGRVEAMVTPGS